MSVQSMVLAFEKSFFLQGMAFLAALPLLYFLRVRRDGAHEQCHAPIVQGE